MANIGNIAATLSLNNTQFLRALGKTDMKMKAWRRSLNRYIIGGFIAITTFATITTKAFAKFEEAMRNVNTIAKQNEAQFLQTSDAALQLGREFGRMPLGLAQALYDINSASFTAAQGLKVLRAATLAGRAGLSTTREAARAITGALNAYALSAKEATDFSDIMFQSVKFGVFTFAEFAGSLGIAVSTAAAAKVPFDQLAAAIATMTRGGINVREAFTALNRVMLRIIQNRGVLGEVFATTAEGSGAAMLKVRGLSGTMAFLQKITEGDTEAMIALGFMVRDLKAALSLTRNEGKDYAKDIGRIANQNKRAGASMEAFKEQTKALSFQFALLKTEANVAAISIGRILSPAMRLLTTDTKDAIKTFNDMNESFDRWGKAIKTWVFGILILKTEIKFAFKAMGILIDSFISDTMALFPVLKDNFMILLKWLQKNWKDIFINLGSMVMTVMENIAKNIWNTFKNLPKLITGALSWEEFRTKILKEVTSGMDLIKIAGPEFKEMPQTQNLFRRLADSEAEKVAALEALANTFVGPGAVGKGMVEGTRIRIGGMLRPNQAEMRRMGEAFANTQQKIAMAPQVANLGATAIEKGSVAAFRAERGLEDPTKKAAEETSANTKKIAEIVEKARLEAQKITEAKF